MFSRTIPVCVLMLIPVKLTRPPEETMLWSSTYEISPFSEIVFPPVPTITGSFDPLHVPYEL